MLRINVSRIDGNTYSAEKPSPEAAQAWVDLNVANRAWGEPAKWVRDGDLSRSDESREVETEQTTTDIETGEMSAITVMVTEYHIPAEYEIVITDISDEIKQRQIKEYTAQKDKECDEAVKALLSPSEDVTHIMMALYDFFVILNVDGEQSPADITASKANLLEMRNLMGQIQALRAARDVEVQAYIQSLE